MDNIDILEEKIKIIESLCTDDCINKETVIKPLKYAIETLIAENKELKEKIKEINEEYNAEQKHEMENTIPKSKVEEVIKEYKKKGNLVGIPHLYGAEIELLQSLLGKE